MTEVAQARRSLQDLRRQIESLPETLKLAERLGWPEEIQAEIRETLWYLRHADAIYRDPNLEAVWRSRLASTEGPCTPDTTFPTVAASVKAYEKVGEPLSKLVKSWIPSTSPKDHRTEEIPRRYFPDEVEYPRMGKFNLQEGCFYEYAGMSILDAVSVHLDSPVTLAVLINRYREPEENKTDFENLVNMETPYHFNVSELVGDDLIVVGRATDPRHLGRSKAWWVLWFDRDVSDCCVGYFRTTDSHQEVVDAFRGWAHYLSESSHFYIPGPAYELPTDKFRGWWHW